MSHDWLTGYQALTTGAGLVDRAERTQIELTGEDRAAFLHNLCTNDIRKLAPGAGCEAFITTVQGKTLAFVLVYTGPNAVVVETIPGQAEKLMHHFDKYRVREKVEFVNRSHDWSGWLLAGPESEAVLKKVISHGSLPAAWMDSTEVTISHHPVWLRRVDLAGPVGFMIDCSRGDVTAIAAVLRAAGAQRVEREAFEAVRIEAGFPFFGRDITENNLPQEVARDARTISFTKGCYLGQETVARIDALGHVNKTLVGLRYLVPQVPKVGATVLNGDEPVGNVTSATWSPKHNAPMALAYVRRGFNTPGTRLASHIGPTEVEVLALN